MTDDETEASTEEGAEEISFADFLTHVAPSKWKKVSDIRIEHPQVNELATPDLRLHCSDDECNGIRAFRYRGDKITLGGGVASRNRYVTYQCDNCKNRGKIFSLWIQVPRDGSEGKCFKFGEYPPFGEPTPPRLLRLFGRKPQGSDAGRDHKGCGEAGA